MMKDGSVIEGRALASRIAASKGSNLPFTGGFCILCNAELELRGGGFTCPVCGMAAEEC
jgi:predicted amidophosphoribosyltransferase